MDHPFPWLRYMSAKQAQSDDFKAGDFKVRNDSGEQLSQVDGFIVDSGSQRPYYVVVDAGGWFKSKRFLVPVGHAQMDGDGDALVVDLSKDRINRFPGFDKGEFEKLSEAELKRMNDEICEYCSTELIVFAADEPFEKAWDRADYSMPDWWTEKGTR